jgi:hypothetical protein
MATTVEFLRSYGVDIRTNGQRIPNDLMPSAHFVKVEIVKVYVRPVAC